MRPLRSSERSLLAIAALNEIRGLAELDEHGDAMILQGYSCPPAAVSGQSQVCSLAESLFTELVGRPVRACHGQSDPSRYRFEIAAPTRFMIIETTRVTRGGKPPRDIITHIVVSMDSLSRAAGP